MITQWDYKTPIPDGVPLQPVKAIGERKWDGDLNIEMLNWYSDTYDRYGKSINYEIKPYNPVYKFLGDREVNKLKELFSNYDNIVDIQHIGSTAIPGQAGKGWIDIVIGLKEFKDLNEIEEILSSLFYFKETRPKSLRDFGYGKAYSFKFFRRSGPYIFQGERIPCGICVTYYNSITWRRKVMFRDYMRLHPEKVAEYTALKISLKSENLIFFQYCSEKSPFIDEILISAGIPKWELDEENEFLNGLRKKYGRLS